MGHFLEKLENISKKNKSLLCVGLDPNPARVPVRDIFEFNKAIIESTQHLVCAYKPNLAFYEALGLDGLRILEKTVAAIPADGVARTGFGRGCWIGVIGGAGCVGSGAGFLVVGNWVGWAILRSASGAAGRS